MYTQIYTTIFWEIIIIPKVICITVMLENLQNFNLVQFALHSLYVYVIV